MTTETMTEAERLMKLADDYATAVATSGRTSMPVYTHPQASEPHPDEFLCPSCIDGKQAYTPPGQASEPAPSTAGARHSAIDAAMGITGEPK